MTDLCLKPNYVRWIWHQMILVLVMVVVCAILFFTYQQILPGLREVFPKLAVPEEDLPSPVLCGFLVWSVGFSVGVLFLSDVIGKEWLIEPEGIAISRFGSVSRQIPWSMVASVKYIPEVGTLFVSTNVSKYDQVMLRLVDEKQGALMKEISTRYLETIHESIKGEKPEI